jgi:dihydrofolate reductase
MGRKTYQSIGEKPLKGRKNIILSNSMLSQGNQYYFDGDKNVVVTRDMDIVYKFARAGEVYVIGGAEIYKQFINLADEIYMTQVHGEFEGDTYFPLEMLDYRDWHEVETELFEADENNSHSMTFRKLVRLS